MDYLILEIMKIILFFQLIESLKDVKFVECLLFQKIEELSQELS